MKTAPAEAGAAALEAWAKLLELFLGAAAGAPSSLAELATPPAGGDPSRRAELIGRFWRDLTFRAADEPGWRGAQALMLGRSEMFAENLAETFHRVLGRALAESLAAGGNATRPWLAASGLEIRVAYNSEIGASNPGLRTALAAYRSVPDGHPLRQMSREDECFRKDGVAVIVLGPVNRTAPPWTAAFHDVVEVVERTRAFRGPQAVEEMEAARREQDRRDWPLLQTTPEQRRIAALEEQLARLQAGQGARPGA